MGDSRRPTPNSHSIEVSVSPHVHGRNRSAQQLLMESPIPAPPPTTNYGGSGKRLLRVNHHSTPKCKMKMDSPARTTALSSASTSPNIPSPNSSITLVNSNSQNNSNTNTASTNASTKTGKGSGSTNHRQRHVYQNHELDQIQCDSFYDNSNSIYTITTNNTPTISAANTNTNSGHSNSGNDNQLMYSNGGCEMTDVQEFLPVCDALFNVISLAIYFCDIVFDILTAYSFYTNDQLPQWAILCFVFIFSSVILSQILSYRLYATNMKKRGHQLPCSWPLLILTHFMGCGVLWRYFKLFIPLDMKLVKNKVRDLLLLRLVHGFVQSAPMLFIQLYLILGKESWSAVTDLNIVSTSFSLLSLCWALASFSKNIRQINVHKLMFTWLGLICQFLWRLGTITSRILSLTLYATVYHYWIFLVVVMHWLSMFVWIISPHFRIFANEKIATSKKYCYSALLAVVYIFCYVNILESKTKAKMLIYYVTMLLENCLLISVWYIAIKLEVTVVEESTIRWFDEYKICGLALGSFVTGLVFMCLYYQYFHITKLNYGPNSSNYEPANAKQRRNGGGNSRSSSLMNGNFESSPASFVNGAKDKLSLTFETCSCSKPPPAARNAACANINNNNNNKDNKFEFSDGVTVTNHALSNKACNNNGNHNSSFHGGPLHQQMHAAHHLHYSNSKRRAGACPGTGEVTVGGKKSKYSNVGNPVISAPPPPPSASSVQVQGVFNCRFNPAMKRKKKKPTTFVPPPNLGVSNNAIECSEPVVPPPKVRLYTGPNNTQGNKLPPPPRPRSREIKLASGDKMSVPFWKRPLGTNSNAGDQPEAVGDDDALENIDSVSVIRSPTTFDIQQKLYEKKQQQLADLRQIEEEIKQQTGALLEPNYMHVHSHSRVSSANANSDHDHFNMSHHHDHGHGHDRTRSRDESSSHSRPSSEKKRPWFATESNSPSQSSPRPPNEDLLYDPGCSVSEYQARNHLRENGLAEYEKYCAQEDGLQLDWDNYDPYALDDDLPPEEYHHREVDGESDHLNSNHVHRIPDFVDEQSVQNISGAKRRLLRKSANAKLTAAQRTAAIRTSKSQTALDLLDSSPIAPTGSAERGRKHGHGHVCKTKTARQPVHQSQAQAHFRHGLASNTNGRQVFYKSCRRIPSDAESQLSLARSYTLPREFKYRRKFHRMVNGKNEQQQQQGASATLPSTNSSDGDVDSGEDETDIYGNLQKIQLPVPSVHHLHIPNTSRDFGTPPPPLPAPNSISIGGSYSSPRKPQHETKL